MPSEAAIAADLRLNAFQWMARIRAIDRRMVNLQRQGRIAFYGPIEGQEAATVGACLGLEERDWIFPALREGAMALMRGMPLVDMVRQCYGSARDICRGRQMPCHFSFRRGRYVAMSSVIATQLPHAVGLALAARLRGTDEIALACIGDGGTSENDFHAGCNFAAVYRAPVVVFCQNNGWAITVPAEKQYACRELADRARVYGMPGERVDGNDVEAVRAAVRAAAQRARAGQGPSFIEALTYRILGHTTSDDPGRYRDEAVTAAWRERDPIERLERALLAEGAIDATARAGIERQMLAELDEAIRIVEAEPAPPPESLVEDVYAQSGGSRHG